MTSNIKTITEEELFEDLNNRCFGDITCPVKIIPENPEDEPVVLISYATYLEMKECSDMYEGDLSE